MLIDVANKYKDPIVASMDYEKEILFNLFLSQFYYLVSPAVSLAFKKTVFPKVIDKL